MPKPHTFPDLYDECKTLRIAFLKKHKYLEPKSLQYGAVEWSSDGVCYASIRITVDTFAERPYLELDYEYNGKPVKYKVYLVSIPSNIGKGKVWYFLCPRTGKRCRKLYMIGTYFLHRAAFKGAMYEKQTQSKNARGAIKHWSKEFETDDIYKQIYSKYFKKQYAGKPTKRFLKMLEKLWQLGVVSEADLAALLRRK